MPIQRAQSVIQLLRVAVAQVAHLPDVKALQLAGHRGPDVGYRDQGTAHGPIFPCPVKRVLYKTAVMPPSGTTRTDVSASLSCSHAHCTHGRSAGGGACSE